MQRQTIHGVPYFIDSSKRLYVWDTEASPAHIGTYDAATDQVTFLPSALSALGDRLQHWRSKQSARPRKPNATAAANSGGHSNSTAAETASVEDDE